MGWTLVACGAPAESTTPTEAGADEADSSEQRTRISGHLLGHDGQPIALAEIHATLVGSPTIEVVAKADGSFSLELPGPGWARLRATGVSHAEHTIEFWADGGEQQLDLRLGTYARPDTVEALAGFGRFDGQGERVNLSFNRGEDGRWAATLARGEAGAEAAEFYYQIANATSEGRTMNGTQADRYVYDGGGDYISVVQLGDADELEIVWDPGAMPPAGRGPELSFADSSSTVARSAQLHARLMADRKQAIAGARAAIAEGTDPEQAFTRAEAELRESLAAAATAASDPVSQRMLWVAWAETLEGDPSAEEVAEQGERAKQVLTLLGPRDPIWSMDEWAMATTLGYVDDPQYFAIAAAEHPDPAVGAALWLSALIDADKAAELERGREAMTALASERFAEVEFVAMAKMYDPDRPTAPGRKVPDFHVSSADGKTEFSASTLRGKTYVLDFWATWCGPCLSEMPRLHAAYAQLNGQRPVEGREYEAIADPKLELISISFDHDHEVVEKFRKEQWPMPWAHAVPDVAKHKQLSEQFGIVGIPTMVLVGPDGTILASSPRLDGGNLGEIAGEALRKD